MGRHSPQQLSTPVPVANLSGHEEPPSAPESPATPARSLATDDTQFIPAIRPDAQADLAGVNSAEDSPTEIWGSAPEHERPTEILPSALPAGLVDDAPRQAVPPSGADGVPGASVSAQTHDWTHSSPIENAGLAALVAGLDQPTDPPRGPSDGQAGAGESSARRPTVVMLLATVLFWILALPVGFACAVVAGDRRASLCARSSKTFGCTGTGSTLGIVMLVATVVVVGTASIYAFDARRVPKRWGVVLGIGVVLLALIGGGAYLMIRTIK